MSIRFLESERIFLGPISIDDDIQEYQKWINNYGNTYYLGVGKFPMDTKSIKNYTNTKNESKNDILFGIFLQEDEKHIGNITIDDIDWIHRKAEIAIIIGDKDYQGQGFAKEALEKVISHCFERLNLNKLYVGIVSQNNLSIKLFENCGFSLEGTLKNEFFLENRYYDVFRYGLLNKSYQKR